MKWYEGDPRIIESLKKRMKESEDEFVQSTHSSFEKISEGSIIIFLKAETNDAEMKLRQYIKKGDMFAFLQECFKTKDVEEFLTKDVYKIDIQIRKVHSATTGRKIKY